MKNVYPMNPHTTHEPAYSHTSFCLFLLYTVGDYDIEIPEDLPSGIYSIRVGRFEDDALFDCSAPFEIINEDEDSMTLSYTL